MQSWCETATDVGGHTVFNLIGRELAGRSLCKAYSLLINRPTHQESHKGMERRDPWRTHAAVAQELPLILAQLGHLSMSDVLNNRNEHRMRRSASLDVFA